MIAKSGGGGFLYQSFTRVQCFGEYAPVGGGPGNFGAWVHAANNGPTIQGRWIVIRSFINGAAWPFNSFQIGIGAPGLETILYPSQIGSYDSFRSNALPAESYQTEYIYAFPCLIPAGSDLSARCKSNVAAVQFRINIELYT